MTQNKLWLALVISLLTGCGGGGGGSSELPNNSAPTTTPAETPAQSPAPPPAPVLPTSNTKITVLALVTPGLDTLYTDPALRIDHLVNVSNRILSDSGVALEFQLSGIQSVDYPDDVDSELALEDVTAGSHSSLSNVAALRAELSADLVVLFRPFANDGRCGIAWIGGFQTNGNLASSADFGYSVVAANCADFTLLHELGHNLGLAHSREETPEGGSFAYGLGFGRSGEFATVMASPSLFAAPRLPRLSSPNVDCLGKPCGISHTDTSRGADAAFAVQQTMQQVADYMP